MCSTGQLCHLRLEGAVRKTVEADADADGANGLAKPLARRTEGHRLGLASSVGLGCSCSIAHGSERHGRLAEGHVHIKRGHGVLELREIQPRLVAQLVRKLVPVAVDKRGEDEAVDVPGNPSVVN